MIKVEKGMMSGDVIPKRDSGLSSINPGGKKSTNAKKSTKATPAQLKKLMAMGKKVKK